MSYRNPIRYGDLFKYLGDKLGQCDNTLRYAREFVSQHNLPERTLGILEETGGYCDCEVLLNSADRIDPEQVIGEETFKTPLQVAEEQGLYCHDLVDGIPVDAVEAAEAAQGGKQVQWHIPCGKYDSFSKPDLNQAILLQRND